MATSVYSGESPMAAQVIQPQLLLWLSGAVVKVPPLRDYAEDVPELLRYAGEYFADQEQLPLRRFSIAAQNRLRHYPWPLNIEELFSLVHRLLSSGETGEITLDELEALLQPPAPTQDMLVKQDLLALPLREAREAFERAYLLQQLQLCNGKVGVLAKRVEMERTHLYRKLRSLGIDFRHGTDD
jgi:DNA-binding NtrC family response regulator